MGGLANEIAQFVKGKKKAKANPAESAEDRAFAAFADSLPKDRKKAKAHLRELFDAWSTADEEDEED